MSAAFGRTSSGQVQAFDLLAWRFGYGITRPSCWRARYRAEVTSAAGIAAVRCRAAAPPALRCHRAMAATGARRVRSLAACSIPERAHQALVADVLRLERGVQHGAKRHHGLETQEQRGSALAHGARRQRATRLCGLQRHHLRRHGPALHRKAVHREDNDTSARLQVATQPARHETHPSRLCRLWSSSSANGRLGGSSRARFAWPNMSPSACAAAPAGVLRAGSWAYHGTFEAGAAAATVGRGDGAGGACIEVASGPKARLEFRRR